MKLQLRGFSNVDTTEGVIWQKIILFAMPLLLSNFLQQLYSAVDMIIVGNYGTRTSLGAVGSAGPIINLMVGFFLGLSTGSSVLVSQSYGGHRFKELYKSVHSSIFLGFLNGLILLVLGVLSTDFMLEIMHTPPELMAEASLYMKIMFIGMVPTSVYNMASAVLRAVGDSRRPLYFLIISVLVNLLLALVFVKYFHWGVMGAAVATVSAQTLSAVLGLITLCRSETPYRLFMKEIRPHKKEFMEILRIGVPAGLQSLIISAANATIQAQINKYGAVVVEGFATEGRISGFFYMTVNSISLALTTFVGQNIGAGKADRVKKGVWVALGLSTGLALALGVVVFFVQSSVLKLFNVSQESVGYAIQMLTITCFLYWLFGIGDVLSGAFRGAGKAIFPMISALINMFVVRLLWVFIAQSVVPGAMTVYWSYPVSWFTMGTTMLMYLFKANWLQMPKLSTEDEEQIEVTNADA